MVTLFGLQSSVPSLFRFAFGLGQMPTSIAKRDPSTVSVGFPFGLCRCLAFRCVGVLPLGSVGLTSGRAGVRLRAVLD